LKKGENLELKVTGKNVITLKNVIVGDIWLCSGQSNMEMPLNLCLGAADDIAAANFPRIRKIKINNVVSPNPEEDAPTATPWQECSPSTAAGFTAVGFYFAREVQEKTGVAIGILDANYGATVIEQWMSTNGINWADPIFSASPFGKSGWSVRYNATIHPFVRLPIKGALWYQGEGNFSEGDAYYVKMRALIEGWRKQWGQGDFPFYFVQIASLHAVSTNAAGGDGWAKIREAQVKSLTITNTGMAVTIDTVPLAEAENIHPRNKYDVGHRLALWALERDYGQKQPEVSGPLFKALAIEGSRARVTFNHTGSGLMVGSKTGRAPAIENKHGSLKQFAIAGADKKWVWADARIEKNTVVVSSPEVKAPVAVRYAFQINPDGANLYNREGLPASPFRTDAW